MSTSKQLYRSRHDRMIAGVCGGIADYFDLDPTVVRVIAVALLLVTNVAVLLAYIVMAIVVPEEPLGAASADNAPGVARGPSTEPPPPAMPVSPTAPVRPDMPASPIAPAPPATSYTSPEGQPVGRASGGGGIRKAGLALGVGLIVVGAILFLGTVLPDFDAVRLLPVAIIVVGFVMLVTGGGRS